VIAVEQEFLAVFIAFVNRVGTPYRREWEYEPHGMVPLYKDMITFSCKSTFLLIFSGN